MSEQKRVRRRGCLMSAGVAPDDPLDYPDGIEVFDDDPADWDALLDVATKLIRAASIGDQYFIPALRFNDPETTKVRHLLVGLADVLRGEIDDDDEPRSEK